MQNSAEKVQELGILAELVYKDKYFRSINPETNIDNNDHVLLEGAYTVVDTHNELLGEFIPDFFGFQAFLLQDSVTQEYVIAFRGTQGWPPTYQTIADVLSDGLMALGLFTQQMEYALRFVSAACKEHGIDPEQITLTGHSLGGSLAEVAGYTFGCETYTYNPFGVDGVVDGLGYTNFLAENQLIAVGQTGNIHNMVALGGDDPDYITGVASHILDSYLGAVVYIKDHTGGDSLGYASHGMTALNNSIAVYNNLLQLFPVEDYNSLSDKLNPVAQKTEQVERFLTTLSELTSVVSNDDHVAWSESIAQSGITNLTLTGLGESDIAALENLTGSMAQLYALLKLNPFVIEGVNYSHLNVEDYLDAKTYSEQFIEDRAAFLYYSMPGHGNTDSIRYEQRGEGGADNFVISDNDQSIASNYVFGTQKHDDIMGDVNEDHLYGMGGDDTLSGQGGNDIIEGGKGKDTMDGGTGEDTFFVQGTDDDYDIFNGGVGVYRDTIRGSSGNDTVRVHEFTPDHSIERIIGGGGEDIIAGTNMGDTIDLSDTELIGIDRVEGGANKDIITGSDGDDILYGGSRDTVEDNAVDLLNGGLRNDIYHVGNGDIINDSDQIGIIRHGLISGDIIPI